MQSEATETTTVLSWRNALLFSLTFGLYLAWVSSAHYASILGAVPINDASLSAVTSITSALFYATIFLLYRRGTNIVFNAKSNAFFTALGLVGILLQTTGVLKYLPAILLGIWVAWFRLFLVIFLVSLYRRTIFVSLGAAFIVCAGLVYLLVDVDTFLFQTVVPLVIFGLGFLLKRQVAMVPMSSLPFTPFSNFWKIMIFAFAFSLLFDVTETHLFFHQYEISGLVIPLGFLGVASVLILVALLIPKKLKSIEGSVLVLATMLGFIGSSSFFISMAFNAPLIQPVLQLTCGYTFVSLLIIASAEISKRYLVPPLMIFSLVFCVQRIGNYAGELIGFGLFVDNPISPTWMDAVAGVTIVFCFALILIFFVAMDSRTTLFETGLLGASVEQERENKIDALTKVGDKHQLTERENDVFLLLLNRYSRKEIEAELKLSGNTIKTHTSSIYRKFDVHSQRELIERVRDDNGIAHS